MFYINIERSDFMKVTMNKYSEDLNDFYISTKPSVAQGEDFLFGVSGRLTDNIPNRDISVVFRKDWAGSDTIYADFRLDNDEKCYSYLLIGIKEKDISDISQEELFDYAQRLADKFCTDMERGITQINLHINGIPVENPAVTEEKEFQKNLNHVKDFVRSWMKGELDDDLCYKVTPANYDDYFLEQNVLQWFNNYVDNNLSEQFVTFENYIYEQTREWFMDSDSYLFENLENAGDEEFCGTVYEDAWEELKAEGLYSFTIEDGCYNGVIYDAADYLSIDYRLNVMFTTESEQNYDMGSIVSFFIDNEHFDAKDDNYSNALSYLIMQQGHTVQETKDLIDGKAETDNKFLKSVKTEVDNFPCYSMCELTALVSLKGKKLIDFLDAAATKQGNIKFDEKTYMGFYNEWSGTGSEFDIELEKPAVFPASMIRNVQIENGGKDNNRGYTVMDTYDFVGSVWKGSCELTDEDIVISLTPPKEKSPKQAERD